MKSSTKLSIAFSVVAVFLLTVGVGALLFIEQLGPLLADISRLERDATLLTEATTSLRAHPDQFAADMAWLDDLLKHWEPTEDEYKHVSEARQLLLQDRTAGRAVEKLEVLHREHHESLAAAEARLMVLHRRATWLVIAAIGEAAVLLVVLTYLLRGWWVTPLEEVHAACRKLTEGNGEVKLNGLPPGEHADIGAALTKIAASQHVSKDRMAHLERMASLGESCTHVTNNIRSTLQSIRTLAEYEGSPQNVDPSARMAFQYIIATVNKLDSWIRALHVTLNPSQQRRVHQQLEPIIHDALGLLQPGISEKDLRVDLQPADSLPDLTIDRVLIEQALVAVIQNAIDASPDGGSIVIRTLTNANNNAIIQVEDQGDGMTETTKQRAFDAFYTTKPNSSGLGLTVAHAVVTRHGGNITLESQPDHGTRVTIELPSTTA